MAYESGYAANCPISRPAKVSNWKTHNDFNGILWNNLWGLFYPAIDEDDYQISKPNGQ